MQGLLTAHGLDPSFLSQDGWKAYTKSGIISSAQFSNKGPWYSYTSMIRMYCDDPTLYERRRRREAAAGRVEDLEAQLGEATRTAKERLLQVEDLKAQLCEATLTAYERLLQVEDLETQLGEATDTMERRLDQVMGLTGDLNRAYSANADLAAELVTVRNEVDRLMTDGAASAKALAELRQRAAPVLDLVQPILTSDAEDVESRLDRLPELQRLAGQYAEQLNAARLSCRKAAKRKREQEDEEHQCRICYAADWDCHLPCQGKHQLRSECLQKLSRGMMGAQSQCPFCFTDFDVQHVAYCV
ncbi:hypothetical protein OEZ85_013142 [Tetradesmus obliquus]|uniref:RING-type domain-containing protein n=1 Tax=Tetradesmus obliquus TaxID=3088 RepID=A0ABY8U7R5_TETOB|nr:hypothetical protein OEZ85_013142 [Tetradesmus obliquus]